MANKIYAFIGPHAAGKRFFAQKLQALGIHYIPSYTTRAPIETNDRTPFYKHVSREDFFKLSLIEKVTYRGEYYGLAKEDVLYALANHQISLVLLEANGLKQLQKILTSRIESIYIMVDYVTLIERMLKLNESNDEIKYHLEYAENNGEFDSWKLSTHVVKNITVPDVALNQILALMGLMERRKF
jgi:guanylate kinase